MALLSSVGLWLLGSLVVGVLANQLPLPWLRHAVWDRVPAGAPGLLNRYEQRLHIRGWKRWIPDAGHALPGGIRKASLARRDPEALQRLVVETRRAELVHWALWPLWLFTLIWLPGPGVALNLLFATLFNLPCLVLQRYNRLRLLLLLHRMAGSANAPASLPPG